MSLASHLIHTCTIENPAAGTVSTYNNKVKSFEQPLVNVRCRLIEDREYVRRDEVSEGYVQSVYKLMIPAGVDLRERARVTKITLEDGTEINDRFEVTSVLVRRGRNSHHQTALLERIS